MANAVDISLSSSILHQVTSVLVFISLAHTQNIVGKTLIYMYIYAQLIRFYVKIANFTKANLAKATAKELASEELVRRQPC